MQSKLSVPCAPSTTSTASQISFAFVSVYSTNTSNSFKAVFATKRYWNQIASDKQWWHYGAWVEISYLFSTHLYFYLTKPFVIWVWHLFEGGAYSHFLQTIASKQVTNNRYIKRDYSFKGQKVAEHFESGFWKIWPGKKFIGLSTKIWSRWWNTVRTGDSRHLEC